VEGRRLRWKELSTGDKTVTVIAVLILIVLLPVLVPYEISKHGWNPKNWRVF